MYGAGKTKCKRDNFYVLLPDANVGRNFFAEMPAAF